MCCTYLHFSELQSLRVGKKVEVLLETRDHDDMSIERGGEEVTADIRHREAGVSKYLIVKVKDKRNGTYLISFVPDVPGKLVLNVYIKGQPVKVCTKNLFSDKLVNLILISFTKFCKSGKFTRTYEEVEEGTTSELRFCLL